MKKKDGEEGNSEGEESADGEETTEGQQKPRRK